MKFNIQKNIFLNAIKKGSVAAMSEFAQSDTSNLSKIIQSIKITIDDNLFFESTIPQFSTKYFIAANESNGIVVEEKGSVLVPAKELIKWIDVQPKDSIIYLKLEKLEVPEVIIGVNSLENDRNEKITISRIGSLKFGSKNSGKIVSKWELECYEVEAMPLIDYSKKGKKCFDVISKNFAEATKSIHGSSLQKDYDHVYDAVSFQEYNGDFYLAATDTKRCSIYNLKVDNFEFKGNILITATILHDIIDILDDDNQVSFYYNNGLNKIFICQTNLEIGICCVDKNSVSKFPPVEKLLNNEYFLLSEVNKKEFFNIVDNASMVNSSSSLFMFNNQESKITVKAISDDNKYKPTIASCDAVSISQDFSTVWNVKHLKDCLKVIPVENIQLYLPQNNKKYLKIIGNGYPNLIFFTLSINNPKYLA